MDVAEHGLEFSAGVKKSRHHSADGAADRIRNLVVFHPFEFAHDDDLPVLVAQSGDRLINALADLLIRELDRRWHDGLGRGHSTGRDAGQADRVVKFLPALDLFPAQPVERHIRHDAVEPCEK